MRAKPTTATKKKAKPRASTGKDGEVDAFMAKSKHPLTRELAALRAVMQGADKRIRESIKWNAPSYAVGEHFATFNLSRPDAVQLVFHTGAKKRALAAKLVIDDPAGLLNWLAKDRAVVRLSEMREIRASKRALVAIVKQWLAQM